MLIDCKILENSTGRFTLERVEQNQRSCWNKWKECGNANYYLAILWKNDVYFVHLGTIDFKEKSIDLKIRMPAKRGFYYEN